MRTNSEIRGSGPGREPVIAAETAEHKQYFYRMAELVSAFSVTSRQDKHTTACQRQGLVCSDVGAARRCISS